MSATGLPEVTVVLLPRRGVDPDVTIESLAGQRGVVVTIVRAGDTETISDVLARAGTFVTMVRDGDRVLAGGLRALTDALADVPYALMAHAFWLPLYRNRTISRGAARAHLSRLRDAFPTSTTPATHVQALPTFRRDWLLSEVQPGRSVDASLRRATSVALRSRKSVIVQSVVGAIPQQAAPELPAEPWRSRMQRARARWGAPVRLLRDRSARFFRTARFVRQVRSLPSFWQLLGRLLRRRTFKALNRVSRRPPRDADQRLAYVLWQYPTLSETFIRREVEALQDAGRQIRVYALESGLPDESAAPPGVTWFGPEGKSSGRSFILACGRRQPLLVLRLFLHIVRVNAGKNSTWWRDRDFLYLAGQLASAMRRDRITHVHAPWANQYAVLSFVAARLIGATFSAQARASEIHRTAQASGVGDRLQFAEFIVTNSRYNEQFLSPRLNGQASRLHVIYNGLDLHRFPQMGTGTRRSGPFHLLGVGRLVEPKGFNVLMRACRLLLDRGLDVTCDIIGGPVPYSDTTTWIELRMLQRQLDLESRVQLLGARPLAVVLESMRSADAFVLPCVRGRDGSHDISPNSLLEAMAMGLPVVSTRSGAVPEIVDDGVNGLLVTPGDAGELADAIQRLERDPALRRTLGCAARRKVEERFDVSRNVQQRIALFRSLGRQES